MLYLTGIHALNIPCNLNSTGDWHQTSLRWDNINKKLKDSDESIFDIYGIEKEKKLNFIEGNPTYNVANHIRACLDLLEEGNLSLAEGMINYICTNDYDQEIFQKVLLLKKLLHWNDIDQFMGKEYKMKWYKFKKKEGVYD